MSRQHLIVWLKILALALILVAVGWNLRSAWRSVDVSRLGASVAAEWRWAGLSLVGCAGVTLTGASVWIWLLRRLDASGSRFRLYGAYCFSQLGKYVPGKVMLVLMRVERTSGMGVSSRAATISTILENAAYMASAAAVGVLILIRFAMLRGPGQHLWLLLLSFTALVLLLAAIHPGIFYRLLNAVLRRLKRQEIEPERRLSMRTLLVSVGMMTPCWCFGGLALWSTTSCIVPVSIEHYWGFLSAFALSVLLGMLSFLPGGLGAREVVQGLLLLPILTMGDPSLEAQAGAKILVAVIVVLQRVFQICAEAALGVLGGWATAVPAGAARE